MKAVLVIDMPSMCSECSLCHNDSICDIIGDVTDDDSVDMRCPLKPMPQKMRTDADDIEENSYWQGWNDCLEEICDETN